VRIEFAAPPYLKNFVMMMAETGLRPFKELLPMKKSQVDLENRPVQISDSKTESGITEMSMTELAHQAFTVQMEAKPGSAYLFPTPSKRPRSRTSPGYGGSGRKRCDERAFLTFLHTTYGTRSPQG